MEYRKLEDLRKLENNPRKISSEDFQILVKSIKDNPDYFEARPLLLSDRTGVLVIIAGNQRYDAAKYLGLKEVPTYLLKGLTEEREREIVANSVAKGRSMEEIADILNCPLATVRKIVVQLNACKSASR